ncbi:MAG TPA: hypothetical protein VH482_25825 [Thermomicrobiales bacterium]|jgi:hypothetical protein
MGDPTRRRSAGDPGSRETPGASGHPEPGSGHDDAETTTVAAGPRVERVDGVPGASGHADGVDAPLSEIVNEEEA